MDPDTAVAFVETRLQQRLSDTQRSLLKGVVQGKTYKDIHREFPSCGLEHLSRNVAPALWRLLSNALGEPVQKKNVIGAIERAMLQTNLNPFSSIPFSLPEGPKHGADLADSGASNGENSLTSAGEANPDPLALTEFDSAELNSLELDSLGLDSIEFESSGSLDGFPQPSALLQSWAEAPDMSLLCGRQLELEQLEQRIRLDNCRLLVIYGVAGIGKSLLVSQLAHRVRDLFASRVWKSMAAQPPLPPHHCIAELMQRLQEIPMALPGGRAVSGGQTAPVAWPAASSQGTESQEPPYGLAHLLEHLFQHECLIVLDGFEALLQSQVHDGRYATGYEAYRDLLDRIRNSAHRSCVIVTTRELPAHIPQGRDRHTVVCSLNGLKTLEGKELLERRRLRADDSSTWLRFVEACAGNPFILLEAAEWSLSLFDGNATEALGEMQPLVLSEVQRIYREQSQRLSPEEIWVLRSLFDQQPARLKDLRVRMEKVPPSQRAGQMASGMNLTEVLRGLMRRSLVTQKGSAGERRYAIAPMFHEYLQMQSP